MKRFYQVWIAALVIKTVLAIWLPFSNDEAYYWVWGHHPQWSYFDHPPMVGWLFWFGTFLESIGNAARLPGVWLGHLTLLIWAKILEPYLDENKLRAWLIFVLLSPFLGLGSLIITPDIPLLFFWSLSLLTLLRTLSRQTFTWYIAFGMTLGLGFCSKYMIVLFVPIALLWIGISGEWRRVRWAYVPVTIIVGLVFCFPVLYWNSTHDWSSFRFQIDHGLSSEKWNPGWPPEYIGGQLLLLFPTVVWLATRRRENKEARFLHYFGWLPLAFFFYSSFKAHVEANWPIMAHPAILALAFLNAPDLKIIRRTAALWAVLAVLVISEAVHHWIPYDQSKLKTSEFTRFDSVLPVARESGVTAPTLFLGSYQAAAAVSYKLRRQIYKFGGMNRRDFYDDLPQSFPESGHFRVISELYTPVPDWATRKGFRVLNMEAFGADLQSFEVDRAKDINR